MSKLNILVVEDEFLVGADIEESLLTLGYVVQKCVPSGPAAIAEVERKLPDVILMDIRLKGEMTGIDAAKIITEKHDVPIIYLTANADINTIEQAKHSLPYGYIIKPFTEKELQTNIEIARFKFENDIKSKIENDQFNVIFKQSDEHRNQLFFDGEDGLKKVMLNDVYFIEEQEDVCRINYRDSSDIIPRKLVQILHKFPEEKFIQISDRHLINKEKVFLAKEPEIIISDKMNVITVQEEFLENAREIFNQH